MQEPSDAQLLRDYAERRNEAAFREIVMRYTDLVYSAALRQVESADLAADIAQNVFVDLARKGSSLVRGDDASSPKSLAGWLHRATRYAALNHLRDTRRRVANERQAMEQLLTNSENAADWGQIRPDLDAALDSLGDEDREALLLRYFKNLDFRAVGLALGVSDDTAQKRVSRAVERLREFFSKRKVTIGASGLTVIITANAVQAAPAGLAVTISTAALAGTAFSTSAIIAATAKTIAMTTLQKTLVAATVAVLAGAGIYEARQAVHLREQNQALQQQQAPLVEQIQQLQNSFVVATNRLVDLLAENAQLKSNSNRNELLKLRGEVTQLRTANAQNDSNDPTEEAVKGVAAKVKRLKQWLDQNPNENIPELKYLTAQDWLRGANYSGDLKTDDDLDRALSQLRRDAKRTFAYSIGEALANYIAGNNGQLPGDISQLESYFNPPIDGTILQRYQILQTRNLSDIPNNEPLIAEKAPVDDQYDTLFKISATGFSYQGTGTSWVNGSGKGHFGTNITAKIKPFEGPN
jgi:RNA polymerase sigma factor (sigma-70 family)